MCVNEFCGARPLQKSKRSFREYNERRRLKPQWTLRLFYCCARGNIIRGYIAAVFPEELVLYIGS